MKVILNKFEDKDGCKGGGHICVISIPMKKFKDQWWSLTWSVSSLECFQKTEWKHIWITPSHSQQQEKTCFQSSRDEDHDLGWRKLISSQGGLL